MYKCMYVCIHILHVSHGKGMVLLMFLVPVLCPVSVPMTPIWFQIRVRILVPKMGTALHIYVLAVPFLGTDFGPNFGNREAPGGPLWVPNLVTCSGSVFITFYGETRGMCMYTCVMFKNVTKQICLEGRIKKKRPYCGP